MMATFFNTLSGSRYVVDGLRVMRHGRAESSFDGKWWVLRAAPSINPGAIVWLDLADPHERSHVFTTGHVQDVWEAQVA